MLRRIYKILLLTTVLVMQILAGIEVDIFVPSLPNLKMTFNLTPFMAELIVGINLASHCFGSLLVGALGDRYGRKPIIIYSLIVFIIGSVICVIATEYYHILIGRILQGIGISGPVVLSYVVIADVYNKSDQQKIAGILNCIIAVSIAYAPVIGSYINMYYGWRGNFSSLLISGLVCLPFTLLIKNNIPFAKKNYLEVYLNILKTKKSLLYILFLSFISTPYWVFIAISPILYMEDLHVSMSQFGFYQGALAASFAITSLFSSQLVKKFGAKKCLFLGICLLLIFFILTIWLVIFEIKDPGIITLVFIIESIGAVFPVNLVYPYMLESYDNAKGKIAAMFTAFRLILTLFFIQTIGYLYQGTFLHLGIAIIIIISIAMTLFIKLYKIEISQFS